MWSSSHAGVVPVVLRPASDLIVVVHESARLAGIRAVVPVAALVVAGELVNAVGLVPFVLVAPGPLACLGVVGSAVTVPPALVGVFLADSCPLTRAVTGLKGVVPPAAIAFSAITVVVAFLLRRTSSAVGHAVPIVPLLLLAVLNRTIAVSVVAAETLWFFKAGAFPSGGVPVAEVALVAIRVPVAFPIVRTARFPFVDLPVPLFFECDTLLVPVFAPELPLMGALAFGNLAARVAGNCVLAIDALGSDSGLLWLVAVPHDFLLAEEVFSTLAVVRAKSVSRGGEGISTKALRGEQAWFLKGLGVDTDRWGVVVFAVSVLYARRERVAHALRRDLAAQKSSVVEEAEGAFVAAALLVLKAFESGVANLTSAKEAFEVGEEVVVEADLSFGALEVDVAAEGLIVSNGGDGAIRSVLLEFELDSVGAGKERGGKVVLSHGFC